MSGITEPPKTICKNCKWHLHEAGHHFEAWYHHICLAPDVQKPITYSIISGQPEEPMKVHCAEVNNGDCPHFVKRGLFKR